MFHSSIRIESDNSFKYLLEIRLLDIVVSLIMLNNKQKLQLIGYKSYLFLDYIRSETLVRQFSRSMWSEYLWS